MNPRIIATIDNIYETITQEQMAELLNVEPKRAHQIVHKVLERYNKGVDLKKSHVSPRMLSAEVMRRDPRCAFQPNSPEAFYCTERFGAPDFSEYFYRLEREEWKRSERCEKATNKQKCK